MLRRLFGTPKLSGLESDAYWMGLFTGLFVSFAITFVLAFALFSETTASRAIPALIVVALLITYPLAKGFVRLYLSLVRRYRRRRRGPPGPDDLS